MISDNPSIQDKFHDEGIKTIDIRRVLTEILRSSPIVAIPIDNISRDLEQWARTLKNDVRLWVVKKYVQFGDASVVAYSIPEEYRPVLDTTELNRKTKSGITTYDVNLQDFLESLLDLKLQKLLLIVHLILF